MTPLALRFRGRLAELDPAARRTLLDRGAADLVRFTAPVAEIIAAVRREGDTALLRFAREFDRVSLNQVEVPRAEMEAALARIPQALRAALERSARNLRTVHDAMRPVAQTVEPEPGLVVGRRPDPLGRVGIYAPGGKAAYPSSVLMGAIPARVAGVGEVIVCSPPDATGLPAAGTLAACALAGVDRVFAIGGAGAIAAMAYGTASVPRVDRIVGPGNAYVATAKLLVASVVGIDAPAGPSELLVLADDTADPVLVAREMIAQAEHDELAASVAVVTSADQAAAVEAALATAVPTAARAEVVRQALAGQGGVLVASSREEMIALASAYAPEHLLVVVADAGAVVSAVRNAGTIFEGPASSVAFGDYMTGANHVLPTGGLARSYSGLSTLDFVRWTTWQRVAPSAAKALAADVGVFADAEGLPGHAAAARAWLEGA